MIDTNALLSIAFSMIASFTNIVEVPPAWVPTKASDLERCIIGRPGWPVHLILTHHSGTEFWINNGAIYSYSSPGSFFTLQDPSLVPNFVGTTTLSSNDVLRIAESALRQLVKSGDPLRGGPPIVQQASEYKGQRVPFFRVRWPKPTPGDLAAQVEIDGRTARIVCLDTWGEGFRDAAFQAEINKRVHAPEPVRSRPQPDWASWPKPTPDNAREAIKGWLAFCRALAIETGTQTNLDDVDWGSCWLDPLPFRSIWSNGVCVVRACHIKFKDGVRFDATAGLASSHFRADATSYHDGQSPSREFRPFEGQPTKRWEDLARDLGAKVAERFDISKAFWDKLRAQALLGEMDPDPPGGPPLKRAWVAWKLLPPRPDAPSVLPEERQLFSVLPTNARSLFGQPNMTMAPHETAARADAGPLLSAEQRAVAAGYWHAEEHWGRDTETFIWGSMPILLTAEFDLETGALKAIEFWYPQLFWPRLREISAGK